jgi:hypothetical protein
MIKKMKTIVLGYPSHWVCCGYTVLPFVQCWYKGQQHKKPAQ